MCSIFSMVVRRKGYVVLSDKLDSMGCLLSPQTKYRNPRWARIIAFAMKSAHYTHEAC